MPVILEESRLANDSFEGIPEAVLRMERFFVCLLFLTPHPGCQSPAGSGSL